MKFNLKNYFNEVVQFLKENDDEIQQDVGGDEVPAEEQPAEEQPQPDEVSPQEGEVPPQEGEAAQQDGEPAPAAQNPPAGTAQAAQPGQSPEEANNTQEEAAPGQQNTGEQQSGDEEADKVANEVKNDTANVFQVFDTLTQLNTKLKEVMNAGGFKSIDEVAQAANANSPGADTSGGGGEQPPAPAA